MLQAHTGHRSTQSLSTALDDLEQVGLVRREVTNQRTYRIEAHRDRLTSGDRAALNLPPCPPASGSHAPSEPCKRYYLTRARVEVLRALLAGGPIDDAGGQAMRTLMGRIGRADRNGTQVVVAGLIRAGLVRRTMDHLRVVGLEAVPDALSPHDRQPVWSPQVSQSRRCRRAWPP